MFTDWAPLRPTVMILCSRPKRSSFSQLLLDSQVVHELLYAIRLVEQ